MQLLLNYLTTISSWAKALFYLYVSPTKPMYINILCSHGLLWICNAFCNLPVCFIHVSKYQRELSKNMNFIFSKNKLSKNFWLSNSIGEVFGRKHCLNIPKRNRCAVLNFSHTSLYVIFCFKDFLASSCSYHFQKLQIG